MLKLKDSSPSFEELKSFLFMFQAEVVPHPKRKGESIYDADTLYLKLDLGFNLAWFRDTRLARINAPELRGPERPKGLISRDELKKMLPVGTKVIVQTFKDSGSFGRYIADIYVPNEDGSTLCLNDWLVEADLAEYKDF